jgi:hypothetical protein
MKLPPNSNLYRWTGISMLYRSRASRMVKASLDRKACRLAIETCVETRIDLGSAALPKLPVGMEYVPGHEAALLPVARSDTAAGYRR